jgi:hypothetical protein
MKCVLYKPCRQRVLGSGIVEANYSPFYWLRSGRSQNIVGDYRRQRLNSGYANANWALIADGFVFRVQFGYNMCKCEFFKDLKIARVRRTSIYIYIYIYIYSLFAITIISNYYSKMYVIKCYIYVS